MFISYLVPLHSCASDIRTTSRINVLQRKEMISQLKGPDWELKID